MLKRNSIILALCVLVGIGSVHAFTDAELESYRSFTNVNMQEVATWQGNAPATATNIFYLTAERTEWQQIEALIDLYFNGLTPQNQGERLTQLKSIIGMYRVTIKDSNPVGLYHIGRDEVYVDPSLFAAGASRVYAESIVFHEKTHQAQNRTFDKNILKVDQRQKYADKLEEIAAHYQQIRYVIEKGDAEAIQLALKNSNRWDMFPGIMKIYPADDPVILTIRDFLAKKSS